MSRGMGTDMTTTWIANGLSPDLPRAVVMHGDWQGVELAIWRSATGRLSAWKDRCPHRGMRLSHGFVRGETLACIYHGWVYGQDGACRHIPAHPAMVPPASIRAEAFACVEQDGVLWVAPAEATDAPPKLNGMEPVRSLPMRADAAALAQVSGLTGAHILNGAAQIGGAAVPMCLLLQPKAGAMMVHALCGAGADRLAVSRWLEGLRRDVENGVTA